MVVGQTAPEHDGFQVEFFAQFLAVFVHAPRQTQSPVVGMDEDLDAVEDVTLAGVGVECFIPRNLGVGVVVLHVIVIHNDRKRAAYDLAPSTTTTICPSGKSESVCRFASGVQKRRFHRHRRG